MKTTTTTTTGATNLVDVAIPVLVVLVGAANAVRLLLLQISTRTTRSQIATTTVRPCLPVSELESLPSLETFPRRRRRLASGCDPKRDFAIWWIAKRGLSFSTWRWEATVTTLPAIANSDLPIAWPAIFTRVRVS